ncbi:hypothetical protein U1Q18_018950, partial [Sarracenia purpurea var. burkii]
MLLAHDAILMLEMKRMPQRRACHSKCLPEGLQGTRVEPRWLACLKARRPAHKVARSFKHSLTQRQDSLLVEGNESGRLT